MLLLRKVLMPAPVASVIFKDERICSLRVPPKINVPTAVSFLLYCLLCDNYP